MRYWVNKRQREASFPTLTEAEVFQADVSLTKVTQGALFVDPRAGAALFGDVRKKMADRMDGTTGTRQTYEAIWQGSGAAKMLDSLPVATVARMEEEAEALVNETHLQKSRAYRACVLR